MSKTITIEIPAPPDGWEWKDRPPSQGEEFYQFNRETGKWTLFPKAGHDFLYWHFYAYRVRDEYAELYEALKLPDGWCAWSESYGVSWCSKHPNILHHMECHKTLRRIVNGKAIRP